MMCHGSVRGHISALKGRVRWIRARSPHFRSLRRPWRGTASTAGSASARAPVQYDFTSVERKWQGFWAREGTFKTQRRRGKEKKYVLDMFPYPSGEGLHVGHPEGYTASDIMARYWRMRDYDVLHPMGWDAFGLPAEQHAILTGTHPRETTINNIATFRRQLKMLGFSYDWEKELSTTDDDFVRWTQWLFLQFFKHGLAAQAEVPVNWCPALGTVLANEEVIDGKSERGDHPVARVPLRQWILRITQYADELLEGLDDLNWPEGTRAAQRAWIGRSKGATIRFRLEGSVSTSADQGKDTGDAAKEEGPEISVFTTRPDTLMGVTYLVLAPEHPLSLEISTAECRPAVEQYAREAAARSDVERSMAAESRGLDKGKTGVFTGRYAVHPLNGERVPVLVADYVLGGYGSGAVMAVPAHDTRDFAFAKEHGLPVRVVVEPAGEGKVGEVQPADDETAYTGGGVLVNSGPFSGLDDTQGAREIVTALEERGCGEAAVNYKLRDWNFSRQRYWGEPIPIYFPVEIRGGASSDPRDPDCDHAILYDQPLPVPEDELPLRLPETDDFKPGEDPQGCLARQTEWRYFKRDGKWYARETNTMPQWAGSCWYYLRFLDPANKSAPWSASAEQDWLPVDLYVGGQEHAVLHLLYARFWHRFFHEIGLVSTAEPFQTLVHQGMILAADGEKMSKSKGNVVNPDSVVAEHGADALRLYEMFMGPLEANKPWQTKQVMGVVRFRDKLFSCVLAAVDHAQVGSASMDPETEVLMNQTVKKVTQDVDAMAFNTAISSLMVFVNHLTERKRGGYGVPRAAAEALSLLVSPFAPHLGEECWARLGHSQTLAYEPWPTWDETKCEVLSVKIGVQVNGKYRGSITLAKDAGNDEAREAAMALPEVRDAMGLADVKKIIYVPGRIVNIVIGRAAAK